MHVPAPPTASRIRAHSQQKAPQVCFASTRGTELRAVGCSIPKPRCDPARGKLRSHRRESVPLGCPRDSRWKRNELGGGTSTGVLLGTGSTQALGLRLLPALCLCSLKILHGDKSKRIFTCPAARVQLVSCSKCLGLRPGPQISIVPLFPAPTTPPHVGTRAADPSPPHLLLLWLQPQLKTGALGTCDHSGHLCPEDLVKNKGSGGARNRGITLLLALAGTAF